MKTEFAKVGPTALAAAIGLALGASATAQQSGQPELQQRPDREQSQSQQAPGAEQRAAQRDAERSAQRDAQRDVRSDVQRERDAAGQSEQAPGAERQAGQRDQSAGSERQASAGDAEIDALSQRSADLSKFVEAVKAAGLGDALTGGDTRYTVFAPTNEAFESMQGRSIDELMSSGNQEELVSLLRAHIVADDVDSQRAGTIQQALTIDGGTVELSSQDGELSVGDAKVVESDIEVAGLTVHAIDGVLEPRPQAERVAQRAGQPQQRQSEGQR